MGCQHLQEADIAATSKRARKLVERLQTLGERPGIIALELADRKSTRLNSSHLGISYAVFCLKKQKSQAAADLLHLRHDPARRRFPRVALFEAQIFFTDPGTTEIYPLSLRLALPI